MIAALFVISPLAANADLINVDFTVTGTSGPLIGVMSSGFFTFDDSVIPGGGGLVGQIGLLTDLSFSWNGIAYDETTANTGWLSFDALETLDDFGFGTNCDAGVCALNSWDTGFILAGPIFRYSITTSAGSGIYAGDGAYSIRSVPDPGTLALLGIGLIGMGLARRNKKA